MTQIQSETIGKTIHITLPPVLGIPSAEALRECVLEALVPDHKLTLESSQVEQISTPGIQMLLAVANYATRKGAEFALANPSETLAEAFADIGLSAEFEAWDATS